MLSCTAYDLQQRRFSRVVPWTAGQQTEDYHIPFNI